MDTIISSFPCFIANWMSSQLLIVSSWLVFDITIVPDGTNICTQFILQYIYFFFGKYFQCFFDWKCPINFNYDVDLNVIGNYLFLTLNEQWPIVGLRCILPICIRIIYDSTDGRGGGGGGCVGDGKFPILDGMTFKYKMHSYCMFIEHKSHSLLIKQSNIRAKWNENWSRI